MFAEDFPRSYDMDLLAVSPLHNCYSHTLAKNLRRPHAKDPWILSPSQDMASVHDKTFKEIHSAWC